ncbi:MAG: hypothetical protein K9J38_01235 [Polynucleobacter sp.]|nr:hypothetical protein [Polynucleobacter sp.]
MKSLLILILIFFSNQSYSGWEKINETNKSITYYFKKDNYKTFFGNVEVTFISNLKYPDTISSDRRDRDGNYINESYLSIRSSLEYDCKRQKQRLLNMKYFSGEMGQGTVVTEVKTKTDWFKLGVNDQSIFCN